MAKVIVVIGAQWGDEGKGKIVDLLAERFDVVARYQGGHNAGHSVKVGDKSYALHLIPSGIIHPGKTCVLGNGMVIDPIAFFAEADRLTAQGLRVTPDRVKVSSRAHLILPYHRALDHTSEERLGNEKVGTTLRGIGPAYEDKAGRRGIRVADAMNPEVLRSRIERNIADANLIIREYRGTELKPDEVFKEIAPLAERMQAFVTDTTHFINRAVGSGQSVLVEGAQATLLDVDHGTYPFVTSSSTTSGGVCSGLGLAPQKISGVLGIVRTYSTRVGEGPFPTEMLGGEEEIGQLIRERGREYGVSTGRPRRCGWFDAVLVRQAVKLGGIKGLALTKLDVLDGLPALKVCTAYSLQGQLLHHLPAGMGAQAAARPVYEELEGWEETTNGARSFAQLPANAVKYVKRLEELVECPVALLSTSPDREDTILVRDPFVD
jgi:adenylosuccinate synthase